MIYTVTLNPALDYVMNVPTLQTTDINRTESEQIYYGGKGINVSVVLTNLGIKNRALGFLAGFSGKIIEEMLDNDNIDNDFIYSKDGHTRINVKIKSEKNMDINAQGPHVTSEDILRLMAKFENINENDTVVLAGSVPNTMPDDIYEKISEKLSQKNASIVVDATGNLLLNVLKYRPFLIKPNHHELGELFGIEIKTIEDIVYYSKKLQKLGAKNVLVSRGKDGAVLLDEYGSIHTIGNVSGKVINSVGCGDSMVAGFLTGWLLKHDYNYALKLGAACGNATAFSETLATKNEIYQILSNECLK